MLAAIRLTLRFLAPVERRRFNVLVGTRALTGLLDVFGIALIGFIASVAATQLDSGGSGPVVLFGFEVPRLDSQSIVTLVVLVLFIFVVKALLAIVLMRAQAYLVAHVEARNAREAIAWVLGGSLVSAKQHSKADFQFGLTASMTYAFTGVLNNVATLVTESFLLLVVTATFFLVDPVVALFALAYFGAVVAIIQLFIGRRVKRAAKAAVSGTLDTISALSDTLDTFREISVLHKQRLFIERISESRTRIARSNATMTSLATMPRYVVETALILGVVILVAQQFVAGSLSTGLVTVGVFLAGGVRMMASLLPLQSALANVKQNVEQGKPSLELLNEMRDVEEVPTSRSDAETLAPDTESRGLSVAIDEVTYRYPGDELDTIHGVTLEVAGGSYAAIIGPSGAGKTTIVDLILGLLAPQSGEVRISAIEPTALRSIAPGLVAYVPQKPGLISGSIAENIALGIEPSEIDYELLEEVVDAAYLHDFIDSLPDGLATSVGKQLDALSGGQIQRIGVARALYSKPKLIVLDEATSGLDASSEAFISSSLRALHGRVTVVVIAHRLSTVQHADVVHVIEHGRVTASGSFRALRASVPTVAEYVKLMSFDEESDALETSPRGGEPS
jgi:ATP-binding cassette subfamily C protein